MQYSPAGRITGFTRTTAANGTDTATFQYDPNGNRKASTRNVAGTTTSAGGNTASTSVTYQHNSAGDLLSDGLTSYHYDSEGRLDSATTGQGPDAPTTKYAHNALGQRVFKTEPLFSSAATPGTGKNLNTLLADGGARFPANRRRTARSLRPIPIQFDGHRLQWAAACPQ